MEAVGGSRVWDLRSRLLGFRVWGVGFSLGCWVLGWRVWGFRIEDLRTQGSWDVGSGHSGWGDLLLPA